MGWAYGALAGTLLAVAVLVIALVVLQAARRRRSRAEVATLLAEREQLQRRVAELTRKAQALQADDGQEYVITRIGDDRLPARRDPDRERSGRRVPDQMVLSAAFGEPLVKVLSFGHGVRRALSPESRNRIGFEMRREMRRSRKVRRREMRQAWRQMRAERAEGVSTSVAAQPAGPPERSGQPARPPERPDGQEDVA